jgi:hypothetical protein
LPAHRQHSILYGTNVPPGPHLLTELIVRAPENDNQIKCEAIMEAILKFNLPDEDHEFKNALRGGKAMSALFDINQMFRSLLKHGDPDAQFKTPTEAVEKLWEEFRTHVEDNDILLSEL